MTNSFMSPLPTFTLESLVTNAQWVAAQPKKKDKASSRKKDYPSGALPSKDLKSEI